ncbi:hypothetical protein M1506_01440 [Patescibacteria group bacterium]|nr:hypothetical protein [Patescibacteria group bacterium]
MIQITLSDAFKGLKRELSFKTFVECKTCGGLGYDKSKGVKKCTTCGGKGEIRENKRTFLGNFSQVRTCPDCLGKGEVPNSPCPACKGEGRVFSAKTVSIDIVPGIEDGQAIKITGGGEAGIKGGRSGDLYIKVNILPDSRFVRKGSDLFEIKDIRITEALLGKEIPTLDLNGEKYFVSIPPGFSLKDKLKVPKKGMPKMGLGGRGDLYLTFNIKLPKHMSNKAKKIIEELNGELDD